MADIGKLNLYPTPGSSEIVMFPFRGGSQSRKSSVSSKRVPGHRSRGFSWKRARNELHHYLPS